MTVQHIINLTTCAALLFYYLEFRSMNRRLNKLEGKVLG